MVMMMMMMMSVFFVLFAKDGWNEVHWSRDSLGQRYILMMTIYVAFDHLVSIKAVAKSGMCYHHPHMKISHVSFITVGGITAR